MSQMTLAHTPENSQPTHQRLMLSLRVEAESRGGALTHQTVRQLILMLWFSNSAILTHLC